MKDKSTATHLIEGICSKLLDLIDARYMERYVLYSTPRDL
jgi:hypothetical protein